MAWTMPGAAGQHASQRASPRVAANPDCYHNAELDVNGLPDNVTFGELQRRMLGTVCDHRGADVGPSWLHHA